MKIFPPKTMYACIGFILLVSAFTSIGSAELKTYDSTLINNEDTHRHFEKIEVWDKNDLLNVEGYRIPGIVVTKKGSVLAFAEGRVDYGDSGPHHIVMKRSVDGGLNWSNNIFIERTNGGFWSSQTNQIYSYENSQRRENWLNPTPLVDYRTGRVFIFYALGEGLYKGKNLQRYSRVFYKYSDDDGVSWSDRVELTNLMNSNKNKRGDNEFPSDTLGRSFHLPGPGHGIQLEDGRLLMQFWSRTALGNLDTGIYPVKHRKYGLSTIYSDDHGVTWKKGKPFGHEGQNMAESRLLELENGNIYTNSRYVNTESSKQINFRMTAISKDRGISWNEIKVDKYFNLSNAVDAGLARLSSQKDGGKSRILYSKAAHAGGLRKNLVVRMSYDEGKTWEIVKSLDEGAVKYSDLAVLPDKTILCLYETRKGGPLYIARFNLAWLTDGKDKF